MKQILTLLLARIGIFLLVLSCDNSESTNPINEEFGYLSLNVALQIEAKPASGRVAAVSPDNFLVTIHDASDGSEVMRWDTYLEVPEEVQLPTGSYFVRATNLEFPAEAAFEQPWYFGESDVFTIDKEELKTIDIECTLANCKISFSYSQNVLDNFTNWNVIATIDDGAGTGAFLEWIQNDPAEGYFLTDLPIDINVVLEYVKLTDPDQSITRTFNHTISDPSPATHYLVNVNASLEDGKIMINISVNEDFETVEIPLGEEVIPETVTDIDGNEYSVVQIGDQLWMGENLRVTQLNDGTPIPIVPSADNWSSSTTSGLSWFQNDESQYKSTFGALYNWYALEDGKICPVGWRVPSDQDWNTLSAFVESESYTPSDALKSTTGWDTNENDYNGQNIYGFNALPASARFNTGMFFIEGFATFWWTTDIDGNGLQIARVFAGNTTDLAYGGDTENSGFSVRCIKD